MNKYAQTGAGLISVMQACPYPEIFDEIERFRHRERAFHDHLNHLLAREDAEKQSKAERAREVCP